MRANIKANAGSTASKDQPRQLEFMVAMVTKHKVFLCPREFTLNYMFLPTVAVLTKSKVSLAFFGKI